MYLHTNQNPLYHFFDSFGNIFKLQNATFLIYTPEIITFYFLSPSALIYII